MKKPILITSIIVIAIATFLTIGFSAFNSDIGIEDMNVSIKPSIFAKITNLVAEGTAGATSTEELDDDNINISLNLPENSTMSYRISITNLGAIEMGVLNIAGLPENLAFELSDYNLGDKICEEDRCKLGITKTFNLTLSYQEGGYLPDSTHYDFNLVFDFRESYSVSITGYESLEYQPFILDGANFEIPLDSEPASVLIDGNPCLTYTYTDGILAIPEVYGNISLAHS